MTIAAITPPAVGSTTKQSWAALVGSDIASLNAQGNPVYGSTNGSPNLINGSYELDSNADGIPDNWGITLLPSGSSAIDSTVFDHGAFSYKFTCPGGGGSIGGGYLQSSDFLPVTPLITYSVRFLTKSSAAGANNSVDIFWFKNDQTAASTASDVIWSDTATNPSSWSRRSGSATPPSDAAFCQIRVTGAKAGSPATSVWYDGVEFFATVATEILSSSSRPLTSTFSDIYSPFCVYKESYAGGTTTANTVNLPSLADGQKRTFVGLYPSSSTNTAVTNFVCASGDTFYNTSTSHAMTGDGITDQINIFFSAGRVWYPAVHF